jgi:Tfp pilus assembly PilM family ATPase
MNLQQLSRQVIHVDVSYLFSNIKNREEFYIVKDQLYYFLIERVVAYGLKYDKLEHITFTDKDKEEIYLSIFNSQRQITEVLSKNYYLLSQEQIMGMTDFVTYGLNYIDKFVHEVIKRMRRDEQVYFNLSIFGNGVISLSYFAQGSSKKEKMTWKS